MEWLPGYIVFGMLLPAYFGWHVGPRKGWTRSNAAGTCFVFGWIGYLVLLLLVRDTPAHVARRQDAVAANRSVAGTPSVADELAALRDSGSLSAQEFDAAKRRLLGPTSN